MTHAPARTSAGQPAAPARAAVRPARHPPASGLVLQRCACGGGCPACRAKTSASPALPVNTPGDAFEHEAERAADAVMSASTLSVAGESAGLALRLCACGGSCPSCRRKEEEAKLRREDAGAGGAPAFAPPVVRHVLAAPGRPLEARTRGFMEERFGADFGGVRVHDDARAAESARAVDAHADTVGNELVFGAGRYAPGTVAGDRLIAHELAHTLQQGGTARRLQRACGAAAVGAPVGCTVREPRFLAGYPAYRSAPNCDDLEPGEEARLVAEARALPAVAELEVHGFATPTRQASFDQDLSCARALRARSALTAALPAGAGIPAARIAGVFSHGPTRGVAASRIGVVVTPPTPTPAPTAVPTPGPDAFIIDEVGASDPTRIFFSRGSTALDEFGTGAIAALRRPSGGSGAPRPRGPLEVVGYASGDEPATLAQERADAVRNALTAAPNPVAVTAARGNAAATEGNSDYMMARSVEIIPAGTPPDTLDCALRDRRGRLVNPPRRSCAAMERATEDAFQEALPVANEAMDRAVAAVRGVPDAAAVRLIDRFFGGHDPRTLATLRTNLGRLQAHVAGLPRTTDCGNRCERGGCAEGSVAHVAGVGARMVLCVPRFRMANLNDRARTLIHESAHATSPLGGRRGEGTRDLAYRHERMLFHLSPADRLRNSDNYALFAMNVREVRLTRDPAAVPGGIDVPFTDSLLGFQGNEPALRLALARLEKRLTWSAQWMGHLYGDVHAVRAGRRTWPQAAQEDVMRQAAALFPLTPPGHPSRTTATDQVRVAGILDRYRRMKAAVKRRLVVAASASGGVSWSGGPWYVAGPVVTVGADFFRATPDHQVSLLLEGLAASTRDVEPAFIPAYVALAEWIHRTAETP